MFRVVGAAGISDLASEAAHTSAEHQAKVFAAAFLIHDEDAAKMLSAQEISEEFGVSLQAAEVCFDRLQRKAERQKSAERVRKSADDVIALLRGKAQPPSYAFLDQACIGCGRNTLINEGMKVRCTKCGFFGDLQDGDPAG
jgi:hypothetical protein